MFEIVSLRARSLLLMGFWCHILRRGLHVCKVPSMWINGFVAVFFSFSLSWFFNDPVDGRYTSRLCISVASKQPFSAIFCFPGWGWPMSLTYKMVCFICPVVLRLPFSALEPFRLPLHNLMSSTIFVLRPITSKGLRCGFGARWAICCFVSFSHFIVFVFASTLLLGCRRQPCQTWLHLAQDKEKKQQPLR